jgi:hypothetical protein
MLCCSALQCTCTWKTWGLNSRYRKKENRRREQKEKSKKSTPLPQRPQDVYALLQCTCTWKTWGSTLGTEKENSREQKKKIVKKSTALPYHYHKDISINLESTLCWSPETSTRHRHVSGSSYTARKEQRRNSEFEPPQEEEFSKQLQLLLGFYSLAWHVSEQFCGKWSCHCFLDTNSYCTFSW